MNKCKLCKKPIPDGAEYCNECLSKKELATDESYLDNLLNSVLEETTTARDVYKDNNSDQRENSAQNKIPASVDYDDLQDFDKFDITEDLDDTAGDAQNAASLENEKEDMAALENTEEDIAALSSTEEDTDTPEDAKINTKDSIAPDDAGNNAKNEINTEDTEEYLYTNEDKEELYTTQDTEADKDIQKNIESDTDASMDFGKDTDTAKNSGKPEDIYNNIDTEFLGTKYQDEFGDDEDETIGPSLEELLKQFDTSSDGTSSDNGNSDNGVSHRDESNPENNTDKKKETDNFMPDHITTPEDELLSLLDKFSPDDTVDFDDIQSITDLLGGIEKGLHDNDIPNIENMDFPNVSVEIQDKEKEPENGIQYITQENDAEGISEEKPKKKEKKGKKASKKENPEEDKGFFQRLFGNVEDDKVSEKQSVASDSAADLETEDQDKEKKKKKKKRGKKTANSGQDNTEETSESKAKGSREPEDKAEDKDKPRKAKKEKKKKEKAAMIEQEIDEGHLNKTGALVVFLFFGILTIIFLAATKAFSYNQKISNASRYFERKDYSQAYNEICGLDLEDEDVELYNKIKTVMIVDKQLDSFNNYYNMREFPEALDSLLKGLKRYQKYIELATMLGIKDDMDYIKDQITDELYHVFSMTEEEAMDIISMENQSDYTKAVYDAVHDIIAYY